MKKSTTSGTCARTQGIVLNILDIFVEKREAGKGHMDESVLEDAEDAYNERTLYEVQRII